MMIRATAAPSPKTKADPQSSLLPENAVKRRAPMLRQDFLTSVPLAVSDGLSAVACWVVTLCVHQLLPTVVDAPTTTLLLLGLTVLPLIYGMLELYPAVGMLPIVEVKRLLIGVSIFWVQYLGMRILMSQNTLASLASLLVFGGLLGFTTAALRMCVRARFSRFHWWRQPTFVLGVEWETAECRASLDDCPELGMRWSDKELPCRILVADDGRYPPRNDYRDDTARVFPRYSLVRVADLAEATTNAEKAALLTGPVVKNRLLLPQYHIAKRMFDCSLILLSVPLLLPLVVAMALLVKTTSAGPIFFSQERPGRNGIRFRAWKFRTMVVNAEDRLRDCLAADPKVSEEWNRNHKLKRDPRITSIGTLLRRSSLDELPQLWNVLRGEMSLVGPRPILDADIAKYGDVYQLYTDVLPGLTGLWQTSGRSNTTYRERLAYDAHYVRNWSPWYDIYLLIRTIRTVLLQEGAY